MKSILMTTSALLLVTGLAAGQAQAACPEDIDAFNRAYEEALQAAAAGEALSTAEQAHLFGLRTAAENLHQAGNAEMCAEVIRRANLTLESAIAPQVVKPDELVGREVVNAQDEDLGEIEDIMLDPVSGRIAYVVVEHGGFLGIGDNLFAVPWGAMQFVPGNDQTLLLDIPEEKLENAPRFSREDETPLERREWVTSVHAYYGVEPYWQDDVGSMAMQYGGGAAAAAPGAQPQASTETGGTGAASQGETGAQTGAESAGETKTIVVPITEPQSDKQTQTGEPAEPQTEEQPKSEAPAEPQTEPQTETQTGTQTEPETGTDRQSSSEPQTGAANLAGTQPPAEGAGAGSEEVGMLVSRIDQLEQQVRTLAEQAPGEEVTQAVSRLEERVQQLSEQMPGEDIKQQIAQLQDQIAALGDSGAAAAGQGGGQGAGGAGQPAAVVVVPGQGTQSGGQQEQQGGGQQEQQSGGQQESGQPSGEQQQESEKQARQQPAGEPGQAGGAARQGEQEQGQGSATEGGTAAAAPAPAPAGEAEKGKSCEEQLAQLEKDLQRAEELGIKVEDARSDFEEAQAMLKNNSEALCSAAIKRAHEELTSVGFDPAEAN